MRETSAASARAWVVHPCIRGVPASREPQLALEEAVALAAALPGLEVRGSGIQNLPRPHPGTLFGKGRIEELSALVKSEGVDLLLVDGPLTAVQQRNLEKAVGCKILDRTGLILEIFSHRAASREGVLQVEMAALSYQRTRLVRAWTHLERQRGGLGFVGGPGETQIEADRRAIDRQIASLRRQLDRVIRTRSLHRLRRAASSLPVVALVGYTNAGKSTLFNRLTGAGAEARDMLFATLDPAMRRGRLPCGTEMIFSDTVGFVSDLPTELVAAFRATLEEVVSADLIVHVRDMSHPETEEQALEVRRILDDLGVDGATPVVEAWNKVDRLATSERDALGAVATRSHWVRPISARTGEGLAELGGALAKAAPGGRTKRILHLGFAEGRKRAWLFERGLVETEAQHERGYDITVRWSAVQESQFASL